MCSAQKTSAIQRKRCSSTSTARSGAATAIRSRRRSAFTGFSKEWPNDVQRTPSPQRRRENCVKWTAWKEASNQRRLRDVKSTAPFVWWWVFVQSSKHLEDQDGAALERAHRRSLAIVRRNDETQQGKRLLRRPTRL